MKVKEEDLRRELLKAINGEDLIINCTRRLGIRLDNFKCKLYTTRIHGIEAARNRKAFPDDDSVCRIMYLAVSKISRKWTVPVRNWGVIVNQLSIMFEDSVNVDSKLNW